MQLKVYSSQEKPLRYFLIIVVTFSVLVLLGGFVFLSKSLVKESKVELSEGPIDPALQTSTPTPKFEFEPKSDSSYKITWVIVRDTKKILLNSNLVDKVSSAEAFEKNGCTQLLSASFYTEEGQHIGLFITEGKEVNAYKENDTFNGVYSISNGGVASISSTPPTAARVAVQTGPRLISNGKVLDLKLQRDENARRIVVATTTQGETIFAAIYNKINTLSGPTLEELPGLLTELDKSTAFTFKDALNLDGGNHSAFLTDSARLSEISNIGSYFCIKP